MKEFPSPITSWITGLYKDVKGAEGKRGKLPGGGVVKAQICKDLEKHSKPCLSCAPNLLNSYLKPNILSQQPMEKINELLDLLTRELTGHNALIQVQIDDRHYLRKIGDMNRLGEAQTTTRKELGTRLFLPWMKREIDRASIAESTRRNHRSTWKSLCRYYPQVSIQQIDCEFIMGFDAFLRENGKAANTIAKNMRILQRYIRLALERELIAKSPFRGYVIKTEIRHRDTLTEAQWRELEGRVEQVEMSPQEREVVDAFRFACITGLRYSDLKRLTAKHLKPTHRELWIVLTTQKTQTEVRLPLNSLFNGLGTSILQNRRKPYLFDLPDNRTCNRILKKILPRMGISQHITFHCARHTAATLLLERGIPITTIQRLLGHHSVRTTQLYSHITDRTVVADLKKGFGRRGGFSPYSPD